MDLRLPVVQTERLLVHATISGLGLQPSILQADDTHSSPTVYSLTIPNMVVTHPRKQTVSLPATLLYDCIHNLRNSALISDS